MGNKGKLALIAILVVAAIFSFTYWPKNNMQNLPLENVEALASGESINQYDCRGEGSVKCYSFYVKYKFTAR